MTRCWIALVMALGACAAEPTTGQTSQELTDCLGSNNFPNAVMPAIPMWNHQAPPVAGNGQGYLLSHSFANGDWLAVLGDVNTKKIIWAVEATPADLGALSQWLIQGGQMLVPRPPPPPPPVGGPAGSLLEKILRLVDADGL
jgi:hypothetical protein